MLPLILLGAVVAIALIANVAGPPKEREGADPHPPPTPPTPEPKYGIGDRVWLADGTSGTVTDLLFEESLDSWIYAFTGISGYVRESELLATDPSVPGPTPPAPTPPVPQPPSPVPPLPGPGPPPDPNRDFKICRLFVLETLDDPIPRGGHAAIEQRYAMAAEWVHIEVGKYVAYHPDVVYLQLPRTSAQIRHIVLSSAAAGDVRAGARNTKEGSPLYKKLRVPADEFAEEEYPGGLPKYIFDLLERRADTATGEPEAIEALDRDNPRNPALLPLAQTWMFLVRGAGGYAGGSPHTLGKPEHIGWGICGDSVLWAWLGGVGLDVNQAHEVIFIEDTWGRQEWEKDYDKDAIGFSLTSRLYFGTADAQTGSFIHESFHGIFAAMHVVPDDIAKLKPGDPKIAMWIKEQTANIMGGSHLDWDNTHDTVVDGKPVLVKSRMHTITLRELDLVDYYHTGEV